jgi:hypothetical protein
MTEGVTQVVEHLPSKCKALCSKPSTTKKEKKGKERKDRKREGLRLWKPGSSPTLSFLSHTLSQTRILRVAAK